jgi:hypothetical protein
MDALQEFIETANRLCARLDKMAEDERQFGFDICSKLENISYETFKVEQDLKGLQSYMRGE